MARAEILEKILLFFLEDLKKPKGHFKINWPLKRQNGRFVDQIISCQISINGIVLPICICFLCGLQWMKDLSYFISKKGCYVGPFIVNFTGSYFCCHSFFISLFRYICILHPEKTFRLGLNAPKVSTYSISYYFYSHPYVLGN